MLLSGRLPKAGCWEWGSTHRLSVVYFHIYAVQSEYSTLFFARMGKGRLVAGKIRCHWRMVIRVLGADKLGCWMESLSAETAFQLRK